MKLPVISFNESTISKKTIETLKILLNIFIAIGLFYIVSKRDIKISNVYNPFFVFVFIIEFFVIFLISTRIFLLSRALNEKLPFKKIYLITLTNRFYNIFFPPILSEGIRGVKYFMAGIIDKYTVASLVLFDRALGFITFSFIFFISASLTLKFDKTLIALSSIISSTFFILLFHMDKIKIKFFKNPLNKKPSKRMLTGAVVVSFMAQMFIMIKYFYIFAFIINLDFDFIKTVYICSASHLSQIIPFSTGLFSIKDAFLFYAIKTGLSDYNIALSFIVILWSIEILTGFAGGIVESMILLKKHFKNYKK